MTPWQERWQQQDDDELLYVDQTLVRESNAHLQAATITSATIGTAQIQRAHIGDVKVTNAKIGNLAASLLGPIPMPPPDNEDEYL